MDYSLTWWFRWVVLFGGNFSGWFLWQVKFGLLQFVCFKGGQFFWVSNSIFFGVKAIVGIVQTGQ